MSSGSKAWVEALKDQGFCRWNHTVRPANQHAKNQLRSVSQAKKLPPSTSSAMVSTSSSVRAKKVKQSEESLRTVMYLSCWGPN
ncbi:hypothetical protein FH972_014539 [Carpinus fangiana]|uniref:Wound-responsive family protein n=1 Tax=Carpinus fangiana TaxID=176857 RepID=A0A5N6RAA8_9ROSI|nr:hypothetical protein FH972_014539 [Carpinus fangiana]